MSAALLGRRDESLALDQLLGGVRAGRSQVLVVRGEAGIGKSALLDDLELRAVGCQVSRAAGVESEMELPFAGLHQVCGPMLGRLPGLPRPQRDALSVAFGLRPGEPPDRLLVGLALLGLLAREAEDRPLVCVVDDAQWLDRASTEALAFVARRLLAEPVALVFAVREPTDRTALGGLPEMTVEGLRGADAHALLESAVPGRLDERVRDRIVAETRGNPLALLELPRGRTAAQLAGGFALDGRPLANRIEQSFRERLASLPAPTRRLLLTAGADPVGDVTLLWRAAALQGIGADAAAPAEAAGLVEFDTRVRFHHPLVRSAVYRSALPADRRAVHAALAEATDAGVDPDRRAWHRAQAAVGPDEAVAGALEASADRAQRRGGIAAAAAFLSRATELTPDPARRGARALAAAQATFLAGAPDDAYAMLGAAEMGPLDELRQARVTRLWAQIVFARHRGSDAPPLLLTAARQLERLDRGLARETYLEALGAAVFAGRLGDPSGARDAARAALAAGTGERGPTDLVLDGVAMRLTDGYASGVRPLRQALEAFREQARGGADDSMRWLWLACPVAPEPVAPELWDDEAWHELATRTVALARDNGVLAVLPTALIYRAGVHVHLGEFDAATALLEEADAISAATGSTPASYSGLLLAAWRGAADRAAPLIDAAVANATARGEGRAIGLAGYASAVLHNGLRQYEAALAGARRACDHDDLGFFGWSLVELVEAATRCGRREMAAAALTQLAERTEASSTDWALGMLARSRALHADGAAAEAAYQVAIERLSRTRVAVHLARAHLVYGEWLRREGRRVDAREQLRTAHTMLDRMGAAAFAERARRELVATGETVRKRTGEPPAGLTAQEAQIARLAAERLTNSEIAGQLFISPRTVEYHLRKIFAKLGVASRRELPRA